MSCIAWLSILYWVGLTVGLLHPQGSSLSDLVTDNIGGTSQFAHFLAFLLLALWTRWSILPSLWLATGVLFIYAVTVEAAQAIVPGRNATLVDGLANVLGVAAGIILWKLFAARSISGQLSVSHPKSAKGGLGESEAAHMRILAPARMWGLSWWKHNVVSPFTPAEGNGSSPRPSDRTLAWRIAGMQHRFDVVSLGGSINLWYSLFSQLLPRRHAAVVMGEMFLPEPNPTDWKWQVKRAIRRFLYRGIDKFIVYSTPERELWAKYLNLPESRFAVILFASNILQPSEHPRGCFSAQRRFGLAAGKSGRDYRTLFEAVRKISFPFVVVSDRASVAGLEVPKNVTVYCNIPRAKYLELLRDAAFTVIPLHDLHRSTGQAVILEGYAFGKPTIASRVIGTREYVLEGKTGYLVSPYNADEMREAIVTMIQGPETLEVMGWNAFNHVLRYHTPERYLEELICVMQETWANRRQLPHPITVHAPGSNEGAA